MVKNQLPLIIQPYLYSLKTLIQPSLTLQSYFHSYFQHNKRKPAACAGFYRFSL